MKGKYGALEIANEVVSIVNRESFGTITNLQLQKIMYYIQGEFISKYGNKAFNETIEAWPYGPVVREVWRDYSIFGRSPIRLDRYKGLFTKDEETKVIAVIKEKLRMNVWDLVNETHKEIPWENADKNARDISDEDMIDFFS